MKGRSQKDSKLHPGNSEAVRRRPKKLKVSASKPKEARASSKTAKTSTTSKPSRTREYKHALIKQPTWQNPMIEYWEARFRRRHAKHPKAPRHIRLERRILAMLACFSISIGLWENFRQLWLQNNGFSATDVSNVISLGMLISVAGILLVGKLIKMRDIKRFMVVILAIRSVNLLALFFLNGTGLSIVTNICTIFDVIAGSLVITSVYPLLTTVLKSNNAYSRRKLVEYLFRDIGILIGGILIGRHIGGWLIDYNACLMVAVVFSILATAIMSHIEIRITEKAPEHKFSVVKYIVKNKIQRTYMIYAFLAGTAFTTAVGLKMLLLTDYFQFSAGLATNYLLLVGLAADILGIAALKYFTPKNDYITMSIKFGIRMFIFVCAFLSDNLFICFIALTWTLLSSTAYENISDGYYINAVDNRHQLKYNTIKHVVTYTGDAVGMFLCGQMFQIGAPAVFGLAAALIVVQLIVAFYLINLRQKAKRLKHKVRPKN